MVEAFESFSVSAGGGETLSHAYRQKSTILDALALVASTTLALAWCIFYFQHVQAVLRPPPIPPYRESGAADTASESEGEEPSTTFFESASCGCIFAAGFSRFSWLCRHPPLLIETPEAPSAPTAPRMFLRNLRLHCCFNGLALQSALALSIRGAYAAMRIADAPGSVDWYDVTKSVSGSAGQAVLATWFVLALIRRFRVNTGWIEILGLVLGTAWIILPFFEDLLTVAVNRP